MFKFVLFIFFFIIILGFLAGFSIIRSIRDALFGPPPNSRNTRQRPSAKNTSQEQPKRSRKKIFKKEEGEYVDYEEIK
ncbi:MAG: DUF4834 family protein [Tannerellaceae bacterium]|nr:DUF4834 family protein [Tannerellaceae bacterium]